MMSAVVVAWFRQPFLRVVCADVCESCTAAAAVAAAVVLQAGGQKYSPSQIGAFVLTKMKETAGEGAALVCDEFVL
jgi:molecular chaperone DnaK (HSP70)